MQNYPPLLTDRLSHAPSSIFSTASKASTRPASKATDTASAPPEYLLFLVMFSLPFRPLNTRVYPPLLGFVVNRPLSKNSCAKKVDSSRRSMFEGCEDFTPPWVRAPPQPWFSRDVLREWSLWSRGTSLYLRWSGSTSALYGGLWSTSYRCHSDGGIP